MDVKQKLSQAAQYLKDSKVRWLIAAATAVVLFFSLLAGMVFFSGSEKGSGANIAVEIKPGMTTGDIADELTDKGIIRSGLGFRIAARLTGDDKAFQEGLYYFKSNMRVSAVLNALAAGPEDSIVRVTIPEGYTVDDIGRLLEEKGFATKEDFCRAAEKFAPYDYMREAFEHEDIKYAAEGFLFPDTYDFDRSYSAEDIMQIMADNFDRKLSPQMRQQAQAHHLTIYQLITIASLVEKEAKYEEDRPIIADVFFKRLKEDMLLQSDATIQYALDEHKEEFSIQDTKLDSPYNTYKHQGLTPGPIGNPGLASIKAALNPSHTDYMYFVADSQGRNHYSTTYDEHQQAINEIYGEQ